MTYSGIFTALITPFNDQGKLDLNGLSQLVKLQRAAGIDGLVVLGTTGEASTLSQQEKEEVVTLVRSEWPSAPLMVGCGAYSTTQTIANIECAAALKADAALVITPFYNKPTQEGIFRHFEAICHVSPLPVMIYNNPSRTGVTVEITTLQRLAEFDKIIGIKETSGCVKLFCDILYTIKHHRSEFSVMTGDDNMAFVAMALGGDGVISGASHLVAISMLRLAQSLKRGNLAEAQALNLSLTPLFQALLLETNPIPLKAILKLVNLPAGHPRLPLTPLSAKYLPVLQRVVDSWVLHG
jgi:4-hydroxy-tetrahydrodipicolinate synthase